ncbi:MAG: hypothetical protein PUK59_07505 [Actinomycetaceae bacterium]|nr:hypothetical protein [Actinomycetaceae bacterium]MDY5854373.1 hypothetical protein [Arcanobacterium sp.]
MVCNTAALPTAADRPADWPDLWTNPKFDKRYEFTSGLGGATTQMVLVGRGAQP